MKPATQRRVLRLVPLLCLVMGLVGFQLWTLHFKQSPDSAGSRPQFVQPQDVHQPSVKAPLQSAPDERSGLAHGSSTEDSAPASSVPKYAGIPSVTHDRMVQYGRWATEQLKGDHSQMSILIGKWTGEKKGGFADRVKVPVAL